MKKKWIIIFTLALSFSVASLFSKSVKANANPTKIEVQINGRRKMKATLNNSSAARQFSRELPKTMHFRNYMSGYEEKIADLHHPLSTKGMPEGDSAEAGEIGYWSPDRRIVFYWGEESYYPGIHIIGRFQRGTNLHSIRHLHSGDRVKITKINN